MSHIRSALAAGMLLFGGALVASAQTVTQTTVPPARGQHLRGPHGQRGGELFKGIALNSAEKANIKNVHSKYATQTKALREQAQTQGKSQAQRDQLKQLMVAERNDLRNALTPANQAKFDANVSALEKRVAERGQTGGRRGPGRSSL